MAWFGYDDNGSRMVGDGFVFIPGLVALVWMFLYERLLQENLFYLSFRLNTFTNRRMLRSEDSWLESSGSVGAKLLIYFCLIMSLITIGGSVVSRVRLRMIKFLPRF